MRQALLAALALAACSRGPESPAAAPPATTPEPYDSAASGGAESKGERSPPAAPAGPRAEAEFWIASLEAPASFRPGEPAAARARIVARGGYHVNLDYPLAFVPAPDATAAFSGPRVPLAPAERRPCEAHPADVCELAADVPLVPGAGALRVSGTLAFSVCTAERCLIEKVPLAVAGATH